MADPWDTSGAGAPNIAGAGNYAQMLAGLFRPPQQQRQQTTPNNPGPFSLPRNADGSINWAAILNPNASTTPPQQPGVQVPRNGVPGP